MSGPATLVLAATSAPVATVFVSSTSDDLKIHRAAVRDAAISGHFYPEMMEYFAAHGNPPLEACLRRVSNASVLVVIVADRYGWIPADQERDEHGNASKSITWLECERALKENKEILAFILEPDHPWPEEFREEYRLTQAMRSGTASAALFDDVQKSVSGLNAFKQWLNTKAMRKSFTTPDSLRSGVIQALSEWRNRNSLAEPEIESSAEVSPYLRYLRDECAYIDIRGLNVGRPEAQRIPMESIYMNLKSSGRSGRGTTSLDTLLATNRLVILGDPGSGKTTYLRRIALILAEDLLGIQPGAARNNLGLDRCPFPIFVRISELSDHIVRCLRSGREGSPNHRSAAAWLPHYLGTFAQENNLALGVADFEARLRAGDCMVLLDGLDEAPDRAHRTAIATLVKNLATAYQDCTLMVTSRPPAFTGQAVIAGFHVADIEPLDDDTVCAFLEKWSEYLFVQNADKAKRHLHELLHALHSRPEIAKMAGNPVMLTALAVLHWHEKKLPNQRAELYESVLLWLSRAREDRRDRLPSDQCLRLLQNLAFCMQSAKSGRRIQVTRRWATEQIAPSFRQLPTDEALDAAEKFLENEEVDSGIIVNRGNQLRYWHLTFQEYLAARHLAGRPEKFQFSELLEDGRRLYSPEWRETVLLFAGILHTQGVEKVDGLYSAIIDQLPKPASLVDRARCAALLGTISRDLDAVSYKCPDGRLDDILRSMLEIFGPGSGVVELATRLEAAEALGQAGDPRLREDKWIPLPAGEFCMGAQTDRRNDANYDREALPNELPVHCVAVAEFAISRFPVTVWEYSHFIDDGGYLNDKLWTAGGFGVWTEPAQWSRQREHWNHPVVGVSWFEAMAYTSWAECHLPTEAEWEYAARGRPGRKYPWGSDLPDPSRANFAKALAQVSPVGLFPNGNTPEGVADMAGNVWEWVADAFAPYGSRVSNPVTPDAKRVIRGGSHQCEARFLRSSGRMPCDADARTSSWGPIGFRCVR